MFRGITVPRGVEPGVRARGCAALELRRGPLEVMLRRAVLTVRVPRGRHDIVLSRSIREDNAKRLAADFCSPFSDVGNPCSSAACRNMPVAESLCICRGYFAAILFLPLLYAVISKYSYFSYGFQKSIAAVFALFLMLPVITVIRCSEKNAFANCRVSENAVGIARGAVNRRILHLPRGSADAMLTLETPLLRLLGRNARVLCAGGIGMVPLPPAVFEPRSEDAVTRLDPCGGEAGSWGKYVMSAAALLIMALMSSALDFENRYITAAACAPVLVLLLYRALAEIILRERPSLVMYRNELVVSGLWDFCVVSARVGRDNIAFAVVSRTPMQFMRGTCTLTVTAAGRMRPIRCRDVDYSRAHALLPRIYRG